LFHACGDGSGFAVSHTTRAARPGEAEGKDYFFTDRASMLAAVARGEFLEHVEVHGNKYGTSYAAVRSVVDAGKVCVLDLDCQGVREIMERPRPGFAPRFVFVRPPSVDALQLRLERRNTETASQIAGRVATARVELVWAAGDEGDFGRFDGVVENADLEEATAALFALVARWHPHLAPKLMLPGTEAAAGALQIALPAVVGATVLR
jgi:guanylate kinase